MESVELDGGRARVSLRGEYDLSNREELRASLGLACRRVAGPVVVDLSEVEFLDGSILDLLAEVAADLQAGGRVLQVRGASAYQRRLFGLVGLADLVDGPASDRRDG